MSGSAVQVLWRAARRLGARRRSAKSRVTRLPPPLLFFTDPRRTPHPERVVERLPRGAAVVYRAFGNPAALQAGRSLAEVARRHGVLLLIGADAALATRLRADGVHLPQRLSARGGVVRALRRRFLVTAAAHDLPAALRAARAGVDALVISPVFPSRSPSAGRPLGPRAFARLVRRAGLPAYALGGVTAATAPRLRASGAVGLAGIEGLLGPAVDGSVNTD